MTNVLYASKMTLTWHPISKLLTFCNLVSFIPSSVMVLVCCESVVSFVVLKQTPDITPWPGKSSIYKQESSIDNPFPKQPLWLRSPRQSRLSQGKDWEQRQPVSTLECNRTWTTTSPDDLVRGPSWPPAWGIHLWEHQVSQLFHNEGFPEGILTVSNDHQSNLLMTRNYMTYCCTFNEPQSDSFIKSSGTLVNCWFPGNLKNKTTTSSLQCTYSKSPRA